MKFVVDYLYDGKKFSITIKGFFKSKVLEKFWKQFDNVKSHITNVRIHK